MSPASDRRTEHAGFGAYLARERSVAAGKAARRPVFDLSDFDETPPGPFERDVKRLVASMAAAGRGSRRASAAEPPGRAAARHS